jgi:hypothetical protein
MRLMGAALWYRHVALADRRQAGFPAIPGGAMGKSAKGDGGLAAAAIA